MAFNPNNCRNESEVESKLIVSYLLPKLGYTPDTWHQEIAFGNIRLDFLSFATQVIPRVLDADSPMSLVMEAKHPKENLDRHLRKLKRYLTSLSIRYGLITNGKELRIYTRVSNDIQLVFQCAGQDLESRFDEIIALIGRDSLNFVKNQDNLELEDSKLNLVSPDSISKNPDNLEVEEEDSQINLVIPDSISENLDNLEVEEEEDSQINLVIPDLISEIPVESNNPPTPEPEQNQILAIEKIAEPLSVNIEIKSDLSVSQTIPNNMKIIAVYHNKGGVGKTTTVVNLAAAMSKEGKRVLVIDLDSQANTTFATGLVKFEDEEQDDLKDCNILQVLQSEDFYSIAEVARESNFCNPKIDVVPSHIDLMYYETELNQLDYSRMILIQKLAEVEDKYDIVLIDTPPSLNFFARVALIAADYLIIPSDLKPFANQGLINVKDFIKKVNGFKKQIGKKPLEILGILPCKISPNLKFVQYSLPKRREAIPKRYGLEIMDSVIYEREDLAKCAEIFKIVGNMEIADPISVLDFKPDCTSSQEFEMLAEEVLVKIGK
ncbi:MULTISPECIES: AAA family ATPase [unclassified Microcoleus]|uniref:AAA family ATPase n=1 Tax=unclassified Microcoleus TaxID=2642155 RepID=UPI0025F24BB9|nr:MULTISPECIES: AAA family ATPase [unclassified Microcoleus]